MKILRNIVISMRIEQWSKNLIVFAGLFFGKSLNSLSVLVSTTQIFFIFCFVSSGSYIINDIIDKKEDGYHPEKSKRPIAAGKLSVRDGMIASIALIFAGLLWSWTLSPALFSLVAFFLALHLLYDIFLKHVAIIDIFTIALAFIIRLWGGVVVNPGANVPSSWILLCTFLLALFLALCKRHAEITILTENSRHHRKSLAEYDLPFLRQLIGVVSSCTILSYALYALSQETIAKHQTAALIYTVPFVMYGIFRYLYLVNMKEGGSNPEKILIRDVPFLVNFILYCAAVFIIIYKR